MTRERARKQRRAKILRRVAQPIHRLRGSLRQTFYGVAGQQRVIDAVIQAIAHEIVFATDIRRNQPRVMFNRGELASTAQEEGRRVLRARLLCFIVADHCDPVDCIGGNRIRQNLAFNRESGPAEHLINECLDAHIQDAARKTIMQEPSPVGDTRLQREETAETIVAVIVAYPD